ncbi:MAG: carboxypeptidase-like regulatory domain-containing protein [Fibrobacter sp.]|nr:carboxypeptidase-like regulatory domain-containing protein [Fibrobacter sp.]
MKRLLVIFTYIFCLLACKCTTNIAGTETTNGDGVTVTAGVNCIEGTAPNGFMVNIYSSDFYPHTNKGYTKYAIVDSSKIYKFGNLESGKYYNLYCYSIANDTSVFIQKIYVGNSNSTLVDTIDFTTTGTVSGNLVDTNGEPIQGADVYIVGSPFYNITNESGSYILNKIPAGSYEIVFSYESRFETNDNPSESVSVEVKANKVNKIDTVVYK